MFKSLSDVPEPIIDFYHEEVRTEQVFEEDGVTPVYTQEEYIYIDENEEEQTGTKSVEVFQEVAYVVLNARSQSVTWEKVKSLVEQKKASHVINKFVDLAMETERWGFYDKYMAYLEECEAVKLYNETEQLDEEGNPIDFPQREMPLEPQFEASGEDKSIAIETARTERNEGQFANLTVESLVFDADQISHAKMMSSLVSWDALVYNQELIDRKAVINGKLVWVLADNTPTLLTKEVLQSALDEIAIRAALLQLDYSEAKQVSVDHLLD